MYHEVVVNLHYDVVPSYSVKSLCMNPVMKIFLLLLFTFCFLPWNIAMAGDFTVELGEGYGPKPKGGYVNGLSSIDQPIGYKHPRYSLKYTFDNGFIIGGEEFGSSSMINDGSGDSYLFVSLRSFSLGWATGEVFRFIFEVGVLDESSVTTRDNLSDIFSSKSNNSQNVDAQWYGMALDWGFWEKDASGIGFILAFRQVSLITDDLFGSGKNFNAKGLYWSGGFRYRF